MRTLLVGCGYWGQNWAKTLYRLGELAAVCDPRPAIQADLKEKYPEVTLYSDLADALQHPQLDTVILATPVVTHLQLAQQCLEAGKHVLVEKPMTMNAEESKVLVELANQKGLVLAVGHILMHHPALMALRQLIREGALGDVLSVQCTRVNLGKVRNEENVWWSLAPHDLSILSLLLEESYELTSASKMNMLGRSDIEDTVQAQFVTPSGRYGSVCVSWLHPVKRHETIVIGTEKMAIFEDTQPVEKKLMLMDYQLDRAPENPAEVLGVQRRDVTYVQYEMSDELLALEAKAFLSAVRQGTPLPNDGENGLQVVRMLENVQNQLHQADKAPALV